MKSGWVVLRMASAVLRRDERLASKLLCVICICLVAVPVFGQSTGKYQVATITDVKPHQAVPNGSSDVVSYDVSVKVENIIYAVLYTPPLGMNTVRYAAGRELLVLVGKKTIAYNDILGESHEVPIVSRRPAAQ